MNYMLRRFTDRDTSRRLTFFFFALSHFYQENGCFPYYLLYEIQIAMTLRPDFNIFVEKIQTNAFTVGFRAWRFPVQIFASSRGRAWSACSKKPKHEWGLPRSIIYHYRPRHVSVKRSLAVPTHGAASLTPLVRWELMANPVGEKKILWGKKALQ